MLEMCRSSSSIRWDQSTAGIVLLHGSTHGKPEVVKSVMNDVDDNAVRGKCLLQAAAGQGLGVAKERVAQAKMKIKTLKEKISRIEEKMEKIMGPEKLQAKEKWRNRLQNRKDQENLLERKANLLACPPFGSCV